MAEYTWDTETFKNIHLIGVIENSTGRKLVFEVSPRKDDRLKIARFYKFISDNDHSLVSFNGVHYDYPLTHEMLNVMMALPQPAFNMAMYKKSKSIITSRNKFEHIIWESDWKWDNIDVFLVSHFDNKSRSVGLKDLEYAMKSEVIMDLPYHFDEPVPEDGFDKLATYMIDHDCGNTLKYYRLIEKKMTIRRDYSDRLGVNCTNFNDTKLGKKYTEVRLVGKGYQVKSSTGSKKQTHHQALVYQRAILPLIKFDTPEFNSMLNFLKGFTATKTKEVFKAFPTSELGELANYTHGKKKPLKRKDKIFPERVNSLNVVLNDMVFEIGSGGIHACIEECHATTDDDTVILDIDVTSFYPSIIAEHKIYPAHMGEMFCNEYSKMIGERLSHAKGTLENAILKLALNGTYGDFNNKYSIFYDPMAMLGVTLNGQLMLMMLAEKLMCDPWMDLTMLQVNTDGMTFKVRKDQLDWVRTYCDQWEGLTGMNLEHIEYSDMWIKNVNNYAAKYVGVDKYKLKGAQFASNFEDDGEWSKDFSHRVIKRAAVAHMTQGVDIADFITNHDDTYDFTGRAKVNRSSKLFLDDDEQQRISRYYVSKSGGTLTKQMPDGDGFKRLGVAPVADRKVTIINESTYVDPLDIDYDFYITQAEKSVTGIMGNVI